MVTPVLLAALLIAPGATEDSAWIERSRAIEADPASYIDPSFLEQASRAGEAYRDDPTLQRIAEQARRIIDQAMDDHTAESDPDVDPGKDLGDGPTYRLFVSRAMGEAGIRNALALAKDDPRITLVFRGPMPGEKVMDLGRYIHSLIGEPKEGTIVPSVVLDPPAFHAAGVERVPTLARYDEDNALVATIAGVMSPRYLDALIDDGRTGNLGTFGETAEIAEYDLMLAMQERAAEAEARFATQPEQAIERFWRRQTFIELPRATTARERRIDPTFEVTQTVTAPDGTVIALQGQRINPLDVMPFTDMLIVFDATDPAQLAFARQAAIERNGRPFTLITTRVHRDDGWAMFRDAEDALDAPLFLLMRNVHETFRLEHVPSLVTAEGRVFLVREIPVRNHTEGP